MINLHSNCVNITYYKQINKNHLRVPFILKSPPCRAQALFLSIGSLVRVLLIRSCPSYMNYISVHLLRFLILV